MQLSACVRNHRRRNREMEHSIEIEGNGRVTVREPRRDLQTRHKMNGSTDSVAVERETKRGEFPPPIAKLLGFRLASAGNGQAVIEFEADRRHANPMGTLHGGVLCDIADAATGFAYSTTLAPGETFTTVDLHINFLRPVWHAKLRAEAGIVRTGK